MKSFNICIQVLLLFISFSAAYSLEKLKLELRSSDTQRVAKFINETSNPPKTDKKDEKTSAETNLLELEMQDYIIAVKERNKQLLAEELELQISQDAIAKAQSIFEPKLVGSYQYIENNKKFAEKERTSYWFSRDIRDENENNYSASIEELLPTGGQINLGYDHNIYEDQINDTKEHDSFMGLRLKQPLLKNGGFKTTMTNINLAKTDEYIIFQNYRKKLMQIIYDATIACLEYYGATEKYKIQQESVIIAEKILNDNQARFNAGKMAETEVWVAKAELALRKSLENSARHDAIAATNTLLTLISATTETKLKINASKYLAKMDSSIDVACSLKKTFILRPEYLSAMKTIEREEISVSFAENQIWPQLDLKASYGLNGLSDSGSDAFDESIDGDFVTWSVGAEFSIPLLGDMKTSSELATAKHKKKQALLELKSIEITLQNLIDTANKKITSYHEQTQYYSDAVGFNKKLLDDELARLKIGKSNSRIVFERQKDLNISQYSEINSFIKENISKLELKMAEGSILFEFGIEVMEIDDTWDC